MVDENDRKLKHWNKIVQWYKHIRKQGDYLSQHRKVDYSWCKSMQSELHSCIYKSQIHIVHTLLQINSQHNRWAVESTWNLNVRKITCLHYQYYSANAGCLKRKQYGGPRTLVKQGNNFNFVFNAGLEGEAIPLMKWRTSRHHYLVYWHASPFMVKFTCQKKWC